MANNNSNERSESCSLSFNSYSSDKLADIALRVVEEFNDSQNDAVQVRDDDVDEEFEFVHLNTDSDASSSAVYPLFNQSLLSDDVAVIEEESPPTEPEPASIGIALTNLSIGDAPPSSSSSSSSSSESEEETERIERERGAAAPPNPRCKKSNSTGGGRVRTKWWRFRDLLKRSHSDGNESYGGGFLNFKGEKKTITTKSGEDGSSSNPMKDKRVISSFYLKNKRDNKKKSYLPYKSFGRKFQPFS